MWSLIHTKAISTTTLTVPISVEYINTQTHICCQVSKLLGVEIFIERQITLHLKMDLPSFCCIFLLHVAKQPHQIDKSML